MIGKVGDVYRVWFTVRNGDGTPRTGLVGANFAVEVKEPADTAAPLTPSVVESFAGDGQYYFDITGAFTTTNGPGQYGWSARVILAPVDIIGNIITFFAQALDDLTVPGDAMDLVVDAVDANAIATAAIDDDALAPDTDVYTVKVFITDDNALGFDRYVVQWFKNGVLASPDVGTGDPIPTLRVFAADGPATVLFSAANMAQIGATGGYFLNKNTNRIASGTAYMAEVVATLDAIVRTLRQPVSRDSA